MADHQMPQAFHEIVLHHLPPDQPVRSFGGRPRIANRIVMKVIWYVLTTGCRWRDVPVELCCSGETARSRLKGWEQLGVWVRIHLDLLRLLRRDGRFDPDVAIVDSGQVLPLGGGHKTGPSPVVRRKPGATYSLLVDRSGMPIGIRVSGTNVSGHREILLLVREKLPKVSGRPGRPATRPRQVIADAGYDSDSTCLILRWLGIKPRIRRRKREHGSGLGKLRWVVERSISWLKGLRRLRVRYDRSDVIIDAWDTIAMCVINFRIWHHDPAAGVS